MGSTSDVWASEPIAIVGMSCKFPGDATNPEKLWEMLAEGRSAWSEVPSSRFNSKGIYHPNSQKLSTTHIKGAHFMKEDPGLFDAVFFNYSAETAATLDPQFRLQLESVYEALENAGLPLAEVAGSKTSVFAGLWATDYKDGLLRDEDNLPRFYNISTGSAMIANRVSHFFDLRGASMTIDTGCSSTLVALHQAVQSLRSGEANASIVAGSNVFLNPDNFKTLGSVGFLSPDGKSYAFDSRANGYGRGEGVATLVIKRLSDARAAGDPIRAVIRESLLNQDGKTETITSPSQAAQEALIRETYKKAGISPLGTQYFEAHGTGTPAGDPIEARAIAAVFQPGRQQDRFLRIGSIKTNIGHMEVTSGLGGVIKTVLALEKGFIPPSINYEKPNPKLALDEWGLKVVTELEPWPAPNGMIRRASINSFGYGGANAHVIIEQSDSWTPALESQNGVAINGRANGIKAPVIAETKQAVDNDGFAIPDYKTKVLVLSAKDKQTCEKMISNLKDYLKQKNPSDVSMFLQNLAYTLGQRRTLLPWVSANIVPFTRGIDEASKVLESPKFTPSRTWRRPRIGMVFTGQGAQWHAMGRELIPSYPIFKASLKEADGYLRGFGADWSLLQELNRDAKSARVNETGVSIPICVALQISLVRLLRAWGITPSAVTSHSSGEIAAAWTVGAINLRQAMAIAYHRAALAADETLRGPVKGGMVAVGLSREDAESYLGRLTCGGEAVIACVNSPTSVTVSGDLTAVQEMEAMAKTDGVFARLLRVDTGYHSHHMAAIVDSYREALQDVLADEEGRPVTDSLDSIAFSSPVTGDRMVDADELADPEHWIASLVQPVEFLDAFTDMVLGDTDPSGSSVDVLVEIGPHTGLGAPINEILAQSVYQSIELPYFGCLVRNTNARDSMQILAANLLRAGHPLDMEAVNFPFGKWPFLRVLTDLPPYPWNHQNKHWSESRLNRALRERVLPPHDILGSLVLGTNLHAPSWRHILRATELPWIRDHVVQSSIVFPGAGYVCLAIEAIKQIRQVEANAATGAKEIAGYRLRDIDILQALVVPDNADGVEIQTVLRPVNDKNIGLRGWQQFEVLSVTTDNRWTHHAKGWISVELEESLKNNNNKKSKKDLGVTGYMRRIKPDDLFASLRSVGVHHGPMFRNVKSIVQSGKELRAETTIAVADTSVPDDIPRHPVIHPTTLDSVIVSTYAALSRAGANEDSARVPRSIENIWVSSKISHEPGHQFKTYTTHHRCDAQTVVSDITMINNAGDDDDNTNDSVYPVLEIRNLVLQSLGQIATSEQAKRWEKEICGKMEWAPDMSLVSPATLASIRKELSQAMDPEESRFLMDLRPVCVYFCQDALTALTPSDVIQLEPHHVKFYEWMQDQVRCAKAGILGPGSETWTDHDASERQRRIRLAAKDSVNGEMVCQLGPHLATMLRQDKAPLELMLDGRLLYRYYQKMLKLDRSMLQLNELLRHVVHKNPRARILEIGAGTGGATRHILQALGTAESGGPFASFYHFTDISSGFFEAGRSEFAAWGDLMTFDKLDIEKDPASQGFGLGSYDIVIACEVLHATKSMAHTMANVRSLMRPGATLLLVETTQDQIDLQFVFGLLPGWWLSEEPQRKSSPSLSVPFWDEILKGAGFSGVDIDVRDCESDEMYSLSAIMSTVPPAKSPKLLSESIVIATGGAASTSTPPADWLKSLQAAIAAKPQDGPVPAVEFLELGAAETAVNGKICVFIGEVAQPILHGLDDAGLQGIQALISGCKGFVWVTRGGAVDCENPNLSLAHGFLRALREEYIGRRLLSLDLDPNVPPWSEAGALAIAQVLDAGFGSDDYPSDFEYAERDGVVLIPRLFKDTARDEHISPVNINFASPEAIPIEPLYQAGRPLCLQVGMPGMLDSLVFGDNTDALPDNAEIPPIAVEIEPRAYGLNFRDIMVAMGQLNDRVMGVECAGVVTRVGSEAAAQGYAVGDRVFCLLRGHFASRATADWHVIMHMPAWLSFEQAAGLPVIFTTVYMALVDVARLRRGQSVLIHAAAGGVGQAAIMLAQHLGAEIFITVGTPARRQLVMDRYGIPGDRIFSSRDTSFSAGVLAATNGRGVDVVLNSLAGPLLQESFNLLAAFGHFIEIGKRDLEQNSSLEMLPFSRHASFTALDLLSYQRYNAPDVHRMMGEISRLIEAKVFGPVYPVKVYPIGDVSKAFRLIQTGKHTGKVVLSIGPDDKVPVLPHVPKARFKPNASYLLVGGVGGLGRSIAYWMVAHGAKNMILLSRSAGSSDSTGAFIAELREAGCRIKPVSCDVSNADELATALRICAKEGMPPVRGVIQAAMVLQDALFERMTLADWNTAIMPKVTGTWNLHKSFEHSGDLDFFVMLSSTSGIVGLASQSNYAAGGAYEDAMARWRTARGLPAVSLDLDAVKAVGYVAERADVAERMTKAGHRQLEEDWVLSVLETAVLAPYDPQVIVGINHGPGSHWTRDAQTKIGRDSRFLGIKYHESLGSHQQQHQEGKDGSTGGSLANQLAEASSRDDAVRLTGDAIANKLADIFMISVSEIDQAGKPPTHYGVDSLVAAELRNMLIIKAAAEISIFGILQSPSLLALASDVVSKSSHVDASLLVKP
ncbi:hypothetical protein MMC17_006637 [Xylographa soralifera]|nr:hypothetical protein [Xylographa soralifera]